MAFGARLSNVVTTTSEDAERCVEFLNRTQTGRATFLPLDTLARREGRQLEKPIADVSGVIGYAHTLVRTAPRFEGIVNFLVGNVLIVTALETGIELVRGRGLRDTIVTLGGEQITGGGAITGGRFQRERSILSRRFQAATLREALVGMREKLAEAERVLHAAHARSEAAIGARDAARERQARAESQHVGLRAEEGALRAEVERTRADLEAARSTVADLRARGARARELEREFEGAEPESEREDAERAALESELAGVRDEIARAESAQVATTAQASELRERAAALAAERDAASARLGMLDQDSERGGLAREEMLAQIVSLVGETRTTHAHLDGLREGVVSVDEQLEAARAQRETLVGQQAQLEADVRAAEQEERDTAAGGERQRTRLAQVEAELGMLVSQFAQNPATDGGVRGRRNALSRRGRLGGRRAAAPARRARAAAGKREPQRRGRARRRSRSAKRSCARSSTTSPRRGRRCSSRSPRSSARRRCSSTRRSQRFREAFSSMYARLFAGGEAKMWQTQPENLSETGIEIAVQPPGKKAMPLAALSGGERAMTAAALIFALIATRPAPFYLLDEVDAALDDANIDRFCAMVQASSRRARRCSSSPTTRRRWRWPTASSG